MLVGPPLTFDADSNCWYHCFTIDCGKMTNLSKSPEDEFTQPHTFSLSTGLIMFATSLHTL